MTCYFHVHFIKVNCTVDVRNGVKNSIKNRKNNSAMKKKCHDNPKLQKQYEKQNTRKIRN